MRECDTFIDKVCHHWHLPGVAPEENAKHLATPRELIHLPVDINEPPRCPPHPLEQRWQTEAGRLWAQVDCQVIAELLSGRTALHSDEHEPIFRRIARTFLHLQELKIAPIRDTFDYILWSPRQFNTVADHAVNATMDWKRDWLVADEVGIADAVSCKSNIRLAVDGGVRRAGAAAIGIALFSARCDRNGNWTQRPMMRAGRQLGNVRSAFLAEAMALEWGLEKLLESLGYRS